MNVSLDNLPDEVLVHIMTFLPYGSLSELRLASRLFWALSNEQSVWRACVSRVFSRAEECEGGDWHKLFGRLLLENPPKGEYQVFLSLDDLPIVRRTMGVAQVFVLTLTLEDDWDCRKLLSGEQSCLTQRVSGDAPWGSFDFVFVCWGSFFAGFSFYRQSQIHSIYLGDEQLGSSSSVMGCMHSGWNDVTGSFLLQPARPFVPNVRENSWGDAFADYHLGRAEAAFAFAVSGGSWQLLCDDRRLITLHVDAQTRGAFTGHAFGSWNGDTVWMLRGCQKGSRVAMLLEEDGAAGEPGAVTLMLLGSIGEGLVMFGVLVAETHQGDPLQTGSFRCAPAKWTETK